LPDNTPVQGDKMDTPTCRTSTLLQVNAFTAVLSAMPLIAVALFLELPRPMVPLSLMVAMSLGLGAFLVSVTAVATLAREDKECVVPSRWVLVGPGMLLPTYVFLLVFGVNRLLGLHSVF
jgi:hypothetical protein